MPSNADAVAILDSARRAALAYASDTSNGALLELMKRAQGDLRSRLQGIAITDKSFTAVQMRAVLAQIEKIMMMVKSDLLDVVVSGSDRVGENGAQSVVKYLKTADDQFQGIAGFGLSLNTASVLDAAVSGTRASVLRRVMSDSQNPGVMERYGNAVVGFFERTLQKSIITQKPWADVRDELITGSQFLQQAPMHWAERIVRTEYMSAHNVAAHKAMETVNESSPIEMVRILCATFDDRTAADSYAVHGQIRRMSEAFESWFGKYMTPPNRPNDREVVVPHHPAWTLPATLIPKTDAEVAERWRFEKRKGSPPPRPLMSTVNLAELASVKKPDSEADRIAAERAEADRVERERERERVDAEKKEQERIAAERAESERIARERESEGSRSKGGRGGKSRASTDADEQRARVKAEKDAAKREAALKKEQDRLSKEAERESKSAAKSIEREAKLTSKRTPLKSKSMAKASVSEVDLQSAEYWMTEYSKNYSPEVAATIAHGRAIHERAKRIPIEKLIDFVSANPVPGLGSESVQLLQRLKNQGLDGLRMIMKRTADQADATRLLAAHVMDVQSSGGRSVPVPKPFMSKGGGGSEVSDGLTAAAKWYSAFTHKSVPIAEISELEVHDEPNFRAFAMGGLRLVGVGSRDDAHVYIHEWGHVIHDNSSQLESKISEYVGTRQRGTPIGKLNDIDIQHRGLYNDDEIAHDAGFWTPYISKIYATKSPGNEFLATFVGDVAAGKAGAILDKDPESFYMALGLLAGK